MFVFEPTSVHLAKKGSKSLHPPRLSIMMCITILATMRAAHTSCIAIRSDFPSSSSFLCHHANRRQRRMPVLGSSRRRRHIVLGPTRLPHPPLLVIYTARVRASFRYYKMMKIILHRALFRYVLSSWRICICFLFGGIDWCSMDHEASD